MSHKGTEKFEESLREAQEERRIKERTEAKEMMEFLFPNIHAND